MNSWKKTGSICVLAAFVLGIGAGAVVSAADKAKDVAKYRQRVMQSQQAHFSAIADVIKGKVGFKDHLADHAIGIHVTTKYVIELFPPGTGADKLENRAKPEIWRDWEKFKASARLLSQESAKLVEVSKGGDFEAFKVQFKAVGKACGGCHKSFRAKKKKK